MSQHHAKQNPIASVASYKALTHNGYDGNVRRYAGGLEDWEAAGHPLQGDLAG